MTQINRREALIIPAILLGFSQEKVSATNADKIKELLANFAKDSNLNFSLRPTYEGSSKGKVQLERLELSLNMVEPTTKTRVSIEACSEANRSGKFSSNVAKEEVKLMAIAAVFAHLVNQKLQEFLPSQFHVKL